MRVYNESIKTHASSLLCTHDWLLFHPFLFIWYDAILCLEFPLAYIWKVIERLWQRQTEVRARVRSRLCRLEAEQAIWPAAAGRLTWGSSDQTWEKTQCRHSQVTLLSFKLQTTHYHPSSPTPAGASSSAQPDPTGACRKKKRKKKKIHPVHLVHVCTSRAKTWKSTGGKMGLVHKGVKEVRPQEG